MDDELTAAWVHYRAMATAYEALAGRVPHALLSEALRELVDARMRFEALQHADEQRRLCRKSLN